MCDLGDLLCKGLLLVTRIYDVLETHSMVSKILISRKNIIDVKHEMLQVLGKYI